MKLSNLPQFERDLLNDFQRTKAFLLRSRFLAVDYGFRQASEIEDYLSARFEKRGGL